jgi:hypothetical protein
MKVAGYEAGQLLGVRIRLVHVRLTERVMVRNFQIAHSIVIVSNDCFVNHLLTKASYRARITRIRKRGKFCVPRIRQ